MIQARAAAFLVAFAAAAGMAIGQSNTSPPAASQPASRPSGSAKPGPNPPTGNPSATPTRPPQAPAPDPVGTAPPVGAAPAVARAFEAQQKTRAQQERELYKLRATYFGSMRNQQIRQAGIVKMRDYTDPALYPLMIKVFEREQPDVRTALLDHFMDRRTEEGDTTLAWIAVFDRDEAIRRAATQRLSTRLTAAPAVSRSIQTVVAEGLRRSNDDHAAAAANLAGILNLVDAIPMLITAQVSGTTAALGSGGEDPALGYILVGQQTAYVRDLTPVIGASAVGFDPEIGVLTQGVYLRVTGATVFTYRVEINRVLVDMTSRAWGQPTKRLGWDRNQWIDWYTKEFLPFIKEHPERARPGFVAAAAGPN